MAFEAVPIYRSLIEMDGFTAPAPKSLIPDKCFEMSWLHRFAPSVCLTAGRLVAIAIANRGDRDPRPQGPHPAGIADSPNNYASDGPVTGAMD
ncbi:MAG: hypothetical protein EA001_16525 [Oscillatoriales cyanobacterium]|nr:MAG: hypothetical protein EA001_16525 [Oscillatoriales cyanobacterium]